MSTWPGIALALSLAHLGTNGLDPATLVLFRNAAGQFEVGSTAETFLRWLAEDPVERAETMRYFVACAFDDKTEIKVGQHTWRGLFGLAQSSLTGLSARPGRLPLRPDEGKWVSACLMAFANMRGWHEYISLRGNPPGAASSAASSQSTPFKPTAAERWTMGHPEGVFLADLLNFNYEPNGQPSLTPRSPTPADLEKSYTLSLNLPPAGPPGSPLNAVAGRTLDYHLKTTVKMEEYTDRIRIARRIRKSAARDYKQGGASPDPDYARDTICVTDGAVPRVVPCNQQGAGDPLRPLFVHAPRVVNLAKLDAKANHALTMQALRESPSAGTQDCPPVGSPDRCVGPFGAVSVISGPDSVPSQAPPAKLLKLGPGQQVVALLRFVKDNEPKDLREEEGSLNNVAYTAIVRYRSASAATAPVQVINEIGKWRDAGQIWPSTKGAFQWLQVFPVFPLKDAEHSGSQTALKIRITGKDDKTPPELDVAGFVPGPPWCHDGQGSFMNVCRGECRGEPLRLHAARTRESPPPERK